MIEKVLQKVEAIKPDMLIAQAKTSLKTMFVDRLTLLQEEFYMTFGSFGTAFITVSRALGKRIGNLELSTAGYSHTALLSTTTMIPIARGRRPELWKKSVSTNNWKGWKPSKIHQG
jgi:hypothetical protein